eukprot:CAMPEP_0117453242 /NCGR_PEP_ID=MMETSP0759-20121206/10106_1 /TAXON_ID=63605 /ORGANISM="Percolomonas cosmopolitus, Strain WS" /LENGTH=174 /DNA_ID=CAMNT_0005246235 /DNA_START=100 /DNA_END=624 /DNA_ORIENTATION=+
MVPTFPLQVSFSWYISTVKRSIRTKLQELGFINGELPLAEITIRELSGIDRPIGEGIASFGALHVFVPEDNLVSSSKPSRCKRTELSMVVANNANCHTVDDALEFMSPHKSSSQQSIVTELLQWIQKKNSSGAHFDSVARARFLRTYLQLSNGEARELKEELLTIRNGREMVNS